MLEIGTTLSLEIFDDKKGEQEKYRSQLIEKNANQLYIDYPIHEKTNKTSYVLAGTKVKVSFVSPIDNAVYFFHSTISGKRKIGNIPVLQVIMPDKDKLQKVQRREFVRVETAVDAAVHSIHNSFPPFTTVTQDISGGGAAIILPKNHHLRQGMEVYVWFAFSLLNGEYHYLKVKSRVIRVITQKDGNEIAPLQFLDLNEQTQQIMFKLCFDRQVEMRKKRKTLQKE